MRHCSVCKIECERPLRCSQCQKTIYCGAECQKADWKVHKRSVCAVKPPMLHTVDKMVKKYSGPGTPMGRLEFLEKVLWEERRRNPTPATACDGCSRRFRGAPRSAEEDAWSDDEDDEGGKGEVEDAGDLFKRCTECDYTICESCADPGVQHLATAFGRPPGTCRCEKSNFGVSYCLSGPSYLDGDGRKPYHGDRHPKMEGSGYDENAFEPRERQCKTCGVVARCLKKEHLKDAMPGMTV